MAIPKGNDVYIVSDLHLGEGWMPKTQRYSRLETFFYDSDFRNFVHAIIRRQSERDVPATLVLNGDCFDFLAVVHVPGDIALRAAGIRLTRSEQEFGLGSTQEQAVWKMDRIINGHPKFFLALAELLAAGHHLAMLRGNHDMELFWPAVQRRISDHLCQIAVEEDLVPYGEQLLERIAFHQWFYYEEGRFYLEHGNQYENTNAVRYVLNPVLPPEYHHQRQSTLDYPMGSLFVRFLYNKMKLLDPFTTHFVTLEQYLRITYHHNFMDLLRTGALHFPYFFKAIREARVFEEQGMAPVKAEHDRLMDALAKSSGVGDKVHEIHALATPPVGTTKYNLLKEMLRPVVRGGLTFLGIALLSLLSWFWLFTVIGNAAFVEYARASMLAILAVVTVVSLFFVFSFVNRALHRRTNPAVAHAFEQAERIAVMLGVKHVSFGHTHTADLRQFRRTSGSYANTGTWIPHPGPWDSFKPKARQFTFATIRGDVMKLHRWHDSGGMWEPVTLLEEYTATTYERFLSEGEQQAGEGLTGAEDA